VTGLPQPDEFAADAILLVCKLKRHKVNLLIVLLSSLRRVYAPIAYEQVHVLEAEWQSVVVVSPGIFAWPKQEEETK
jgi:hypothetical protein